MKIIFIILISIAMASCSSTFSAPPLPEKFDEFSIAATQIANQTLTTQISSTPTLSLVDTNSTKVIFRDDFGSQLKSSWVWLNEDVKNWNLQNRAGFLQITTTKGYFYLGNASNILLYPAPTENFAIETSMLFDPSEGEQFAGLIMLESSQNFIQVGIGYCPTSVGCIQEGIYIDIYKNAQLVLPRNAIPYNTGDALFIRASIQDNIITIHGSKDSLSWYLIFETPTQMKVSQVGLMATQNNTEAEPDIATFDYFEISLITP